MLEILRSLLISFFAVAVLLPVVRYAMRRMAASTRGTEPLTAEEVQYMQKQEWKLTLVYFFFACVLSVFSAGILALFSSIIHSAGAGFMYLLTPNFKALFSPGLLLGLTLAVFPLRLVQQSVMGHDYAMYRNYLQQTEGSHSMGVYRILFLVMIVLSAAMTWFALKWHVSITPEQVEVTTLLSESRTYSMAEIESIRYLGAEGEYLITFSDNTILNTTYLKPVQLEMIALLSAKSGKKVIR